MNILPKKKWHVRTSENIARVRKDEAKAAEDEREMERRAKLAEQEARTSLMRARARHRVGESVVASVKNEEPSNCEIVVAEDSCSVMGKGGHVNFFQQLEDGEGVVSTNKEHEEEKKKEQEEYEKKVGYLTYLGQDTEELTGEKVWWKKISKDRFAMPESDKVKCVVSQKQKEFLDPLGDMRKYLKCDGVRLTMKKHQKDLQTVESKAISFEPVKKRRRRSSSSSSSSSWSRSRERKSKIDEKNKGRRRLHSSSDSRKGSKIKSRREKKKKQKKRRKSSCSSSNDEGKCADKCNLEKMRRERLERERVESKKANQILHGESIADMKDETNEMGKTQKYSSQFHPDCARQNKLDPTKKYWLQ